MQSLVFDIGCKEYDINGDSSRVIRVNTSDWNILRRVSDLKTAIAERVKKLGEENGDEGFDALMSRLSEVEGEVREEVDRAFGSPVCDAAFGSLNCLSFAGGQPVVLNFLNALLPEMQKDLEAETEQAYRRIEKYTDAAKRFE